MRGKKIRNIVLLCLLVCTGIPLGVAAVSWAWNDKKTASSDSEGVGAGQDASATPTAEGRGPLPVMLRPAERRTFEEKLIIAGTVLAKRFALVSARIPGTLDQVFVDAGDRVEAGKTKLFQTDSLKLEEAVAIARHQLTVADCAVKEKMALLEKTRVAQEQALTDLNRYRQLRAENAIAQQMVEHQEAQCRQLAADIRHVETLIALAQAQLEQARLNLRIAEKDLADSLVLAPLSGRVSLRLKEPGEMAGAGTPVLRIEDGSLVEISVFVPSEYYERVSEGQTKFRVRVGEASLSDVPVTFKSPTVESRLRTFQVKALVHSPPAEVVPGALAQVEVILDRREGVGVPAQAVVQRSTGHVVFTVLENRARALSVQLGLMMDGWQEIRSGVDEGTPVVVQGQSMLEENVMVRVLEEQKQ